MAEPPFDASYELEDRYRRESGRIYITGVQALVRLPLLQHQRDLAAGLNTAGFISGYRGSPLGTYDMALWQARDLVHAIVFAPTQEIAKLWLTGRLRGSLSDRADALADAAWAGVSALPDGEGPGTAE